MKQINYKKLILPNIPYVFFVYLFDKAGQAVRLAPGADISAKILNIAQGFSEDCWLTLDKERIPGIPLIFCSNGSVIWFSITSALAPG